MPRSNPRVSILIPTFNQEQFIDSCVASALDQTYDNLEVIVSDDASSDSTAQIARRFLTDPRVRWERNPINIGRVDNYRRLLYELRGDERDCWLAVGGRFAHGRDPLAVGERIHPRGLRRMLPARGRGHAPRPRVPVTRTTAPATNFRSPSANLLCNSGGSAHPAS